MVQDYSNNQQLTDEDFKRIDTALDTGFNDWARDNIGTSIVKHGYQLEDNSGLIEAGYSKVPFLSLYVDTDYFDPYEIAYFLGMNFLRGRGFGWSEEKWSFVSEIIVDVISNYIEVYPLSDLE